MYGHEVCSKCRNAFAYRRDLAYIIDTLLYFGCPFLYFRLVYGVATPLLIALGLWAAFLLKDGFEGHSPGKAILGLRVISEEDGEALGFGRSLMRNLPMLIPFAPIVMYFELGKGHRTGDGWSKAKVIWKRFASNVVFLPKSSPGFVETPEMNAREADRFLAKAIRLEVRGDYAQAASLYEKVVTDYPETQQAKDASTALRSIRETCDPDD